jgi:hypothetical protein
VGAGSDADVVGVAPVDEVVAGLFAGPRVVRDFVGGEARPVHAGLGEIVEGRGRVVVEFAHRAALAHGVEGRAFFERQLVERIVRAPLRERAGEFGVPCFGGLAWPCVDQIERGARKSFLRQGDGAQGFVNRVQAA